VNQGLIHINQPTLTNNPWVRFWFAWYIISMDFEDDLHAAWHRRQRYSGNHNQELTTPVATAPDSQAGVASSPGGGTYRLAGLRLGTLER